MRRLHDTGRSGYLMLLSIVPIANLFLIVFFVEPSQEEMNKSNDALREKAALKKNSNLESPKENSNRRSMADFAPKNVAEAAEPAQSITLDKLAEIERIANLRNSGAISDKEFQTLKNAITSGE